jgi:hypothetical protein
MPMSVLAFPVSPPQGADAHRRCWGMTKLGDVDIFMLPIWLSTFWQSTIWLSTLWRSTRLTWFHAQYKQSHHFKHRFHR